MPCTVNCTFLTLLIRCNVRSVKCLVTRPDIVDTQSRCTLASAPVKLFNDKCDHEDNKRRRKCANCGQNYAAEDQSCEQYTTIKIALELAAEEASFPDAFKRIVNEPRANAIQDRCQQHQSRYRQWRPRVRQAMSRALRQLRQAMTATKIMGKRRTGRISFRPIANSPTAPITKFM